MTLPVAFLLGLMVVVAHREMGTVPPGAGTVDGLLPFTALLCVPWLLAAFSRAGIVRALLYMRRPPVPPRALLRLSVFATPLVLHALYEFGAYGDWVDRLAPDSHLLRILLAMAPLYVAELPRTTMATMAEALLEAELDTAAYPVSRASLPRWVDVGPAVRLRFGWPLLALMPVALLGVALDVLQLHRPTYVFALATTPGLTLGTILFLVTAAMLLPLWFRVAFGVRRGLPEPIGAVLRDTAAALGFSPRRLFVLPTGMRAMNAMMVGPLPVGRLLCVTDGLLSTLDVRSLTGVVAHEIGHARMGHPGTLMLLSPLRLFEGADVDVVLESAALVVGMLAVWLAVRTLARRFEHEADVASVRALGAEPCCRALITVTRLSLPAARGRLLSMHPDEKKRVQLMQRYESDAGFRERFDRTTVRVRAGVAVVVLAATVVGAWFWRAEWPLERVLVDYYSGDLVGAQRAIAELDERPERWRATLERVEEELAVAVTLAPGARDQEALTAAASGRAWARAEDVLLAEGPAAARPWFAVALAAIESPTTVQRAVREWCEAAADGDVARMAQLAEIVRRLGVPARLGDVFAAG